MTPRNFEVKTLTSKNNPNNNSPSKTATIVYKKNVLKWFEYIQHKVILILYYSKALLSNLFETYLEDSRNMNLTNTTITT